MSSIRIDASKQHYTTTFLVVGYALCSSLLAIINKYAITQFNYPGLLTALQYLTSALGVYLLGKLGFLHHDPFTLTPLLVALADTVFRHQPCPSKLTFFSLVVILAGAVGYVSTDSAFTLTAYSWAFAYLVTITTEMVYIKHMVMNLGLNTWGFVLYNNLLSLMIAPLFWFLTGENLEVFDALRSGSGSLFDPSALAAVGLSCVFGLAISFFGFAARKAVSATAFTVTGVVNKFLTVAINVLIWDKHASPFGLLCLLFTIVGGVLYQQSVTGPAPVQRDTMVDVEKNPGDYDDDGHDLEAERLLKAELNVKDSTTREQEDLEVVRSKT
ncbi:GDP-fucose transporter 1 [Arachis duranensis]|uniref:GDP-fucose transporter 1 n=1 Tax=Arachis duranensis TaxID=130453 RepID=A0A6P4BWQ2_ARADU|nr:GDP-fucose transporter 1 [Arachis duranensis]